MKHVVMVVIGSWTPSNLPHNWLQLKPHNWLQLTPHNWLQLTPHNWLQLKPHNWLQLTPHNLQKIPQLNSVSVTCAIFNRENKSLIGKRTERRIRTN